MFCVDGSRKYRFSGIHRSTSWKISPRSSSSRRKVFQGDFQGLSDRSDGFFGVGLLTAKLARGSLTVSVSVNGSSADRSSGFSMFLRKYSFKEVYALLESDNVFVHAD